MKALFCLFGEFTVRVQHFLIKIKAHINPSVRYSCDTYLQEVLYELFTFYHRSKLSFECIFLYIPLTKIYELFPLYHEMDFSHVVKLFNELYEKESAFSILLKKYKYSLKEIAERIGVPYDTLYSFKQRRRDIKKINIESALKLSNIFNVRIETIAEIRI